VTKTYPSGDTVVHALRGIDLALRDSEFVAVLGQSGSGKTTLLNLIGGLDRYDSGDIVIGDVSTKDYSDRDWDSYRNHSVGFVFQTYNLIPHQTVLANVELALTISGVGPAERKRRATEALTQVGLADQLRKLPNQLSGGQMQRVAIARALVNDPDILLADEPTGALDSDTSLQVMDLLKEVARDRLVVMVTHNPDLADRYATRVVKLHDGAIVADSHPFTPEKAVQAEHRNLGKATMSFATALSLSFNNLRTKKGRTIMTAFAGSIGIIGIALIIALSTGVNNFITDTQKETMLSYPVTIQAQSLDLSSLSEEFSGGNRRGELTHELDQVYANNRAIQMMSDVTASVKQNNLTPFKAYLDDPASPIHQYLGENGVVYTYAVKFDTYGVDPDGVLVKTDGSDFNSGGGQEMASQWQDSPLASLSSSTIPLNHFTELLPGQNGEPVSPAVIANYDLLAGSWPTDADEVVLMVDSHNEVDLSYLYELGFLPSADYQALLDDILAGKEATLPDAHWTYADILGRTFYAVPAVDYYQASGSVYTSVAADKEAAADVAQTSGIQLTVTGIVRSQEDNPFSQWSTGIGYTSLLTDEVIAVTNSSPVVLAQEADPDRNVLNGAAFAPGDDAQKVADARSYLSGLGISDKAKMMTQMMALQGQADQTAALGEAQLAGLFDQHFATAGDAELLQIYNAYITPGTYDDNMKAFGVVDYDAPATISLYADSFENKEAIGDCIADYNATQSEADQITYTDLVGLLMGSVTTMINVVTYVLVAFVGVSLVVSSIMIGIITFISVLERTKEIGILRAIGASKRNISQVFNAETFIVGLLSGVIGVGVSLLLLIPGNAIIHHVTGLPDVNAVLPVTVGAVLIVLSMVLTLIAGIIPSRAAAKKDPVVALRTE
jgi:putative ABC transport system permease protein